LATEDVPGDAVIVRLNGGLANTIFQAAFGLSLENKKNEAVQFHRLNLGPGYHRAYGLGAFRGPFRLTEDNLNISAYNHYQEASFGFDPAAQLQPKGTYFSGCFQTEKYFNEEIVRDAFQLKNPLSETSLRMLDRVKSHTSCSVHVRRTDYTVASTAAYHGLMGMDYYNAAIQYIKQRTSTIRFFVFSDEPDWCRTAFVGREFTIVDHNKPGNGNDGPGGEHEDLSLMSACTHGIMPNSSFSWWGNWLATDKNRMVVAPKHWFNPTGPAKDFNTKDIVPERWIRL